VKIVEVFMRKRGRGVIVCVFVCVGVCMCVSVCVRDLVRPEMFYALFMSAQ